MLRRLDDLIDRVGQRIGGYDLMVLVCLLVMALASWGFIELADEVMEGETHSLDERIILALRAPGNPSDPLGPPWLEEIGRDCTALGGIAMLALVVAAVCGFLAIRGTWHAVVLCLGATLGGLGLSLIVKELFSRPRPALVPHLSVVMTSSFPSGHSLMSAVVYLTLGALLARLAPGRRLKIYCIAMATIISALVGVSRVYLGVHWPTDVVAGWALGLVWAIVCWLAAKWLQRRGAVEPST